MSELGETGRVEGARIFPQNQPLNETLGVKIKAKRLTHNQSTGETLFKGNVEARHGAATLYADELRSRDQGASASVSGHVRVIDLQRQVALEAGLGEYHDHLGEASLSGGVKVVSVDPYALPLTLTGQTALLSRRGRSARIEGGVRVTRAGISATAGAAQLDEIDSSIELQDGVEAHAGSNHVSSRKARFERQRRVATFEGGVKARFVPAQVRAFAADPVKLSGAASVP